jgi:HlyD family secretion protein
MKKAIRAIVILAIVAGLAAAGVWFYRTRMTATAEDSSDGYTQVVSVQRGDLIASISVVGELYAVQQEDLYFDRASGTTPLLTLEVATGHVVQEGQVLAAIDPSTYTQVLDQVISELQEAEAALADLQEPATKLELSQADLGIARSQLDLRQAEQDLDDLLNQDTAELQSKVADASLELLQAQSDLSDLESDTSTADQLYKLGEAEADRSAEYTRLATETYLDEYHEDRLRRAYNTLLDAKESVVRAETQAEVTLLSSRTRVRTAERKLVDAQEALAKAKAGVDELDVAKARLAIAQAEVALAEARQKRADLDEGPNAVALASAQATLDKKRLAVTEAQLDLDSTIIRAPFGGTVMETGAEVGGLVNANTLIVALANLDGLQILASVDETTIRQIEVGQPAAITFDAFPGQQFSGQVLAVPLQGELQGGVMVYQVPVSLEGAEELTLLVGMTANVDIQVGRAENALLVPTMALLNVGGFQQVLVPSSDPEGAPQAVPVEVGLGNGVYTVVARGLNEGDQVLVQIQSTETDMFSFGAMRMIEGGGGAPPQGPQGREFRPRD